VPLTYERALGICTEAQAGRFNKEMLLFDAAGIPTYVVMAELATNIVLTGELARPEYPEALAFEAARRWRADASQASITPKRPSTTAANAWSVSPTPRAD